MSSPDRSATTTAQRPDHAYTQYSGEHHRAPITLVSLPGLLWLIAAGCGWVTVAQLGQPPLDADGIWLMCLVRWFDIAGAAAWPTPSPASSPLCLSAPVGGADHALAA